MFVIRIGFPFPQPFFLSQGNRVTYKGGSSYGPLLNGTTPESNSSRGFHFVRKVIFLHKPEYCTLQTFDTQDQVELQSFSFDLIYYTTHFHQLIY